MVVIPSTFSSTHDETFSTTAWGMLMKFVLIHKWGRSLGQSFIKKEPNKLGDEISELTLCT